MRIPYRKFPGKLAASAALVALLGAGGAALYLDTVADYEGYVPYGYRDPVGIPTKCFGDTENVVLGKEYTRDECVRSINEHGYEIAKPVMRCIPNLAGMPDKVKASVLSMSYNIGPGAMCKSTVAQYMRAGQWERGCRRMAEIYRKAGGRDLKGLVNRRRTESEMCLEGLREMK